MTQTLPTVVTRTVGIDPGLSGGIAVLPEGYIQDTPTAVVSGQKNRRVYLVAQMVAILKDLQQYGPLEACIEAQHAMPGQGVVSTGSLMYGFGLWIGILAGLEIPYTIVQPQTWKKTMLAGMGKDKDASRVRAQQLFPQLTDMLNRKSDHGRAEALLIANWGRTR